MTDAVSETTLLLNGVKDRDPRSIARAITAIENQTAAGIALSIAVRDQRSSVRTIGVTGPPGAGKSTLINGLSQELLKRYERIAIISVDPSSPISGGAVLGDRVRMAGFNANPNVFIRSLAARGHLGGVTRTTQSIIDLLAAGSMGIVIVETVGTGQSEVEVADLTDVNLVVTAPGLGDEMQAIKAGILEIADILVVNKSDLPDAARTASYLNAMLHNSSHNDRRTVMQVSSTSGDGITPLADAIAARFLAQQLDAPKAVSSHGNARTALAIDVAQTVAAIIHHTKDARIDEIEKAISAGDLSRADATRMVIPILCDL